MGRLDGRIAFVTGGARGIGRAISEKFVAEGATVTFADVDEAAGQQTAGELAAAGTPATFCRADITVEADVRHAIEGVVARHGTLDVLVNNAGVNAYYDATAMTEAEWDRVFGVDLKSAWLCAKYALPPMQRAGRDSAFALGHTAGSRNMGLMLAASAGMVPELVWLYVALALVPFTPAGVPVIAACLPAIIGARWR
jgi:NAD(P)-dependent dehydrogenase (short-subunit alcohol dehydrogenase family)